MTTLIIGGTGHTGLALAHLLTDAGHPVLLTSRKGKAPAPFKAVTFDWHDQSTFENPFTTDSNIDRAYIIAPDGLHPGPVAKPFIDLAIAKGVKRFVLLGASQLTAESASSGELEKILQNSGAEYVVLKPTWFQDNFNTMFGHSIRGDDAILSSMGDGLVPLVATRDIAEAAFDSLTAADNNHKEVLVFGPELLTYEDAAKLLSSVLGREITYTAITADQMKGGLIQAGLPEDYAKFLTEYEQRTREGVDRKQFESDSRKKWIGKYKLLDYFKDNRDLWLKS